MSGVNNYLFINNNNKFKSRGEIFNIKIKRKIKRAIFLN